LDYVSNDVFVCSSLQTELCHTWSEQGSCKYGTKCQFAHGSEELRQVARHPKYKTEICRNFVNDGTCPYGIRCRFIHPSKVAGNSPPDLGAVASPAGASGALLAGSRAASDAAKLDDMQVAAAAAEALPSPQVRCMMHDIVEVLHGVSM
jgi:hypothetical protein